MADKNEEMAQQMRADGVDEAMIARFVAKEMQEDEFRRGRGMTDIEAARAWKRMPENIQQLLLGSVFCPNCGTASFASGYSLRMRDGFVLIEGRCAACGAEIARLCDQARNFSDKIKDLTFRVTERSTFLRSEIGKSASQEHLDSGNGIEHQEAQPSVELTGPHYLVECHPYHGKPSCRCPRRFCMGTDMQRACSSRCSLKPL